jgi:hypothetical protein
MLATAVDSASTPRPLLASSDEWAYRQSSKSTPLGPDAGRRFSMALTNRDGHLVLAWAPLKIVGSQRVWNMKGQMPKGLCMIDLENADTLGLADSCSASLAEGASWTQDRADTAVNVKKTFTVGGTTLIEVPAGRFTATRIDAEEIKREVINASMMTLGAPVRTLTRFWYSPQAKGMVRIERERFDEAGKLTGDSVEVLAELSVH